MSFIEIDLARERHRARMVEVEESRRASHAAAVRRLQHRAARLARRAERVSRRAERAAAQARLAVARVI
jgi:hypothetical protein